MGACPHPTRCVFVYSGVDCYERTTLVGAEDHFGPWAGVGTGPYGAFVYSGVETRVDCYENDAQKSKTCNW